MKRTAVAHTPSSAFLGPRATLEHGSSGSKVDRASRWGDTRVNFGSKRRRNSDGGKRGFVSYSTNVGAIPQRLVLVLAVSRAFEKSFSVLPRICLFSISNEK